MSDQQEYKKMQGDLNTFKTELAKYQQLFESDGHVDASEQQQIATMQETITQAESKLAELLGENTSTTEMDGEGNYGPDWTILKEEYIQSLSTYINSIQIASERAHNHIARGGSPSKGSIGTDILFKVIDSFGLQYKIGTLVLRRAAEALGSGTVGNLTEFHTDWNKKLDALKRSDVGFNLYRNDFRGYTHQEARVFIRTFLEKNFIPEIEAERIYIKFWIDSAKDKSNWFGLVDHDQDAGYVHMHIRYQFPDVNLINAASGNNKFYEDGYWYTDDIYFDDLANASGTNNALKSAYGGNTPVSELPFKLEVMFELSSPGKNASSLRLYPQHGPQKYIRKRNGGWTIEMGSRKMLDFFLENYLHKITVNDLGVE